MQIKVTWSTASSNRSSDIKVCHLGSSSPSQSIPANIVWSESQAVSCEPCSSSWPTEWWAMKWLLISATTFWSGLLTQQEISGTVSSFSWHYIVFQDRNRYSAFLWYLSTKQCIDCSIAVTEWINSTSDVQRKFLKIRLIKFRDC